MKAKFLIALCTAALFAVSCGSDEPIIPEEPEVPEKVKEPVIEGPVRMKFNLNGSTWWMTILGYDDASKTMVPVNKVDVELVGGSGDYKVIYPEDIFYKYEGDESSGRTVPYSEDILKVWAEGDIIHVERVIPAYNPNGSGGQIQFEAYFEIEDSSGEQKTLLLTTGFMIGGL